MKHRMMKAARNCIARAATYADNHPRRVYWQCRAKMWRDMAMVRS